MSRRLLWWEPSVDCCCLGHGLSSPLFLGWPEMAQEAGGIQILPHSD